MPGWSPIPEWDANDIGSDNLEFDADLTVTGVFRTSASGSRIEILDDSGVGKINAYNEDGTLKGTISIDEATGAVAVTGGNLYVSGSITTADQFAVVGSSNAVGLDLRTAGYVAADTGDIIHWDDQSGAGTDGSLAVSYSGATDHVTTLTPPRGSGVAAMSLKFQQNVATLTATTINLTASTVAVSGSTLTVNGSSVLTSASGTAYDSARLGGTLAASYHKDGSTIKAATGSAAAPGLTFNSDPDTGFYDATNAIYVTLGGSYMALFQTTQLQLFQDLLMSSSSVVKATDGSVSAPAYAFSSLSNTGMYYGSGALRFAYGGVQRFAANATRFYTNASMVTMANGTSNPSTTVIGDSYFNTSDNTWRIYNGSAWKKVTLA